MGITNWIKANFRSDPVDQVTAPVEPVAIGAASIVAGQLKEALDLRSVRNRYSLADNLVNSDERLFSAIELMAIMVQKAIGEFTIRPESIDDRELSRAEKQALKTANDLWRKLNMPRLGYRYTKDLWKYGDAVDQIRFGKGIESLVPLPLFVITAVDKRDQIGQITSDVVISDPKFYVIDEQDGQADIDKQVIRHDRVFHISFDNKRSWIKDNLGRWTFNVWSVAPINSLIGILMWKKVLINNDQVWRNRALPREHHKLDLSVFDPSKFQGTYQEKIDAAKEAAEAAINSYAATNARREADQGFVTGKNVEINYVEPKTANYNDPSGIINQINTLIGGPTGTPADLMGGGEGSGGFTSLVHASSFLAMRAEVYLDTIKVKLEELTRRHVGIIEPTISEEIINRLELKTRLILDRDRAELAKIISVLSGSKAFTTDEIRQIWGLDPMTSDQEEDLLEWHNKISGKETVQTPDETSADLMNRDPGSERSPNPQESPMKRQSDLLRRI